MIIDAHAHVTGPMEMYEYFRGYTNVHGPVRSRRRRAVIGRDSSIRSAAPDHGPVSLF